jgi:hypothetical protein
VHRDLRPTKRPHPYPSPQGGGEHARRMRYIAPSAFESSSPTRRTPWRKARCAATRKRRSRSRTRTRTRAPPPPRRSPACTARPPQSPTARNSQHSAANTLPCRGRVDARSASGWVRVPRPYFLAALHRRDCINRRRAKRRYQRSSQRLRMAAASSLGHALGTS